MDVFNNIQVPIFSVAHCTLLGAVGGLLWLLIHVCANEPIHWITDSIDVAQHSPRAQAKWSTHNPPVSALSTHWSYLSGVVCIPWCTSRNWHCRFSVLSKIRFTICNTIPKCRIRTVLMTEKRKKTGQERQPCLRHDWNPIPCHPSPLYCSPEAASALSHS